MTPCAPRMYLNKPSAPQQAEGVVRLESFIVVPAHAVTTTRIGSDDDAQR